MSQHKLHVRKGDTVVVLSGKDKGKKGKVLIALPKEGKVVVEDVNVVTKHQRPTPTMQQGGLIKQEAPIFAAKVMLVCPACKQPTRVGRNVLENGTKVRVCKKCNENIDK
ncbi:MAG: 50S ribosomal protein L24 [Firmicutes bacterium]|nr:50S ribosomal protein L24 [Bacillota bacterium]